MGSAPTPEQPMTREVLLEGPGVLAQTPAAK